MSWLEGLVQTRGDEVTVLRDTPVSSFATKQRSSNSTDPATRDFFYNGYILTDSGLASGDLLQFPSTMFLTQSVEPEHEVLRWFGVKCNAAVAQWRYTEWVDEDYNVHQDWVQVRPAVTGFMQIVTAKLRQTDVGLLDTTRYVLQVPKALAILADDRLVYEGNNFVVDSIDDAAMAGVVRLQLGIDTRS